MRSGIGHVHGLDLALLWLWCRPAGAAPTVPLAWELLCAKGVALKNKTKQNKTKTKTKKHKGQSNMDTESDARHVGSGHREKSFLHGWNGQSSEYI